MAKRMSYTDQVAEQNRRLANIEDDLGEINKNLAALAEHVNLQNGRIGKLEHKNDSIEKIVSRNENQIAHIRERATEDRASLSESQRDLVDVRIGASRDQAEQDHLLDWRRRVISNWDKIVTGLLLAAIAWKVFT